MTRSVNNVIKYVFDYREFAPSEDQRTLTENFINLENSGIRCWSRKTPCCSNALYDLQMLSGFPFSEAEGRSAHPSLMGRTGGSRHCRFIIARTPAAT